MKDVSADGDRVGFYLFAFGVAVAPLPFGAAEATVAACVGLLLGVSLLASAWVPIPSEGVRGLHRNALLLAGAIVVYGLAQATLWDPATTGGSGNAGPRLVHDVAGPPSAPRYHALYALGYILIPLAGFMCALAYVRDERRYMRFVHIVLVANVVATLFAIGQHLVSPQSLLWTDRRHYPGSFTGTFVNPNTAATHFGFLLVLALAASAHQLERTNVYRLLFIQDGTTATDRTKLRMLIAYALAALVFALALLLTGSRAGIFASLAGAVAFAAAFAFLALRSRTSAPRALGISALGGFGVIAVFAVFGERFLLRLQDQGLTEEGRVCAYASIWKAIKDGPWWGAGLGTFQDVFPAYRSPECGLYGHWEMAHSVFLEGWLSLGIVFPVCAVFAYYHLIRAYARGVRVRRRFRFVPLGCLGLLLILTLHSLVDFSLQVPGFALMAAAALGTGAAVSLGGKSVDAT